MRDIEIFSNISHIRALHLSGAQEGGARTIDTRFNKYTQSLSHVTRQYIGSKQAPFGTSVLSACRLSSFSLPCPLACAAHLRGIPRAQIPTPTVYTH